MRSAPTFWISPVSRNRSSSPCIRSVISPISSRKMVPLSAISSLPGLSRYAPVKLPFTCPNSSDSSRVSGMPAQLTGTNPTAARVLAAWMARATTSLPEPLSPVISTLASERATRSTSALRSEITVLVPINWTFPICLIVSPAPRPLGPPDADFRRPPLLQTRHRTLGPEAKPGYRVGVHRLRASPGPRNRVRRLGRKVRTGLIYRE